MGNRISLSKARAMRDNDSRKWTAEELLLDMIEQIRRGEIKPRQIAVHWFEEAGDRENTIGAHDYIIAQCKVAEHLMLLEVGKQCMLDMLRSGE